MVLTFNIKEKNRKEVTYFSFRRNKMAIDVTKKPKISLSKVVLEKTGETHKVDLSKSNEQITINLNRLLL